MKSNLSVDLIRKARTTLRLAVSIGRWPDLYRRAGENMRALRLWLHRGGTLLYRHWSGFPFVVLDDVDETRVIFLRGKSYERTEAQVMKAWLVRGDSALDCGANVGLFTALMSHRAGPTGRVVSIEPAPTTYQRLSSVKNVLELGNVETMQLCLSDREGSTHFSNDSLSSEANSIVQSGSVQAVDVEKTSLDKLIGDKEIEPALVKLDIEGAEALAFKGWHALATCPNPPLLIFEIFPRGLRRLGNTPADVFEHLPEERFDFWHVNFSWPNEWPEFPRGVPFSLQNPREHPWPTHSNVIAVPKDGRFARRRESLRRVLGLRTAAPE